MPSFYLSKPYQPPQAPVKLPLDKPWALFGGINPNQFMTQYWHKKPLLIRGAIPAFALSIEQGEPLDSPIPAKQLLEFALNEKVESRLVKAKPWSYDQGPFSKPSIPSINMSNWTLLFQGMEAHHPAAAKILSWFRFIPDARLDDLMISIAGVGGGVGPHFDSYDVFLIQMSGRRKWRISEQKDLSLNPKLPLKILQHFKPGKEWILEPGDMLYLPPHIAHDGIALDPGCQTWSVGFRSPSLKELLQEGLWRLAESLEDIPDLDKKYADPKQKATHSPEKLPGELIQHLASKLTTLKLDQINTFLPGITSYLSEPKSQAIFETPKRPLNPTHFQKKIESSILSLHPQTRILSLNEQVYCNGENVTKEQNPAITRAWRSLSESKFLSKVKIQGLDKSSLYEAYLSGWLTFEH